MEDHISNLCKVKKYHYQQKCDYNRPLNRPQGSCTVEDINIGGSLSDIYKYNLHMGMRAFCLSCWAPNFPVIVSPSDCVCLSLQIYSALCIIVYYDGASLLNLHFYEKPHRSNCIATWIYVTPKYQGCALPTSLPCREFLISLTSQWHHDSLMASQTIAPGMFVQQLVQHNIGENRLILLVLCEGRHC